jgi:hypothetical protein
MHAMVVVVVPERLQLALQIDRVPEEDAGGWAKARVCASTRPPAERAAVLAEIERQYRAALEAVVVERAAELASGDRDPPN